MDKDTNKNKNRQKEDKKNRQAYNQVNKPTLRL